MKLQYKEEYVFANEDTLNNYGYISMKVYGHDKLDLLVVNEYTKNNKVETAAHIYTTFNSFYNEWKNVIDENNGNVKLINKLKEKYV